MKQIKKHYSSRLAKGRAQKSAEGDVLSGGDLSEPHMQKPVLINLLGLP